MVPGKTRTETFAFWPSDLLAIFRAAGMVFNAPPPWADACELDRRAADGQAPEITSPQPGLIYSMRSEPRAEDRIPFSAVGDGDARRFYWFVDNHFIGMATAGQPLLWAPRSGAFEVQVVDDHSRAAMTDLTVEMVR
jgi:penicillin-binding protein 1C